jgi:hypothetical protein
MKIIVTASTTQHRIQVFNVRRVLSAGTTQEKKPGCFAGFSDIEDWDQLQRSRLSYKAFNRS